MLSGVVGGLPCELVLHASGRVFPALLLHACRSVLHASCVVRVDFSRAVSLVFLSRCVYFSGAFFRLYIEACGALFCFAGYSIGGDVRVPSHVAYTILASVLRALRICFLAAAFSGVGGVCFFGVGDRRCFAAEFNRGGREFRPHHLCRRRGSTFRLPPSPKRISCLPAAAHRGLATKLRPHPTRRMPMTSYISACRPSSATSHGTPGKRRRPRPHVLRSSPPRLPPPLSQQRPRQRTASGGGSCQGSDTSIFSFGR